MQTNFTAEQLEDPHIQVANQILRKCVRCGFCTATCPTYVLLGDELDSPRGRIYLIKNMLERGEAATAETVKHIDRCLSCLSCMTTCPSGVHYMHLIDDARAHVEKTYKRPLAERALRALLAFLMPRPGLFKSALILSQLVRPLAPLIEKLGDKRLSSLLALVPKETPPPEIVGQPGIYPAEGQRRLRVALLRGCVQSVLDPAINEAAIRLMNRHGIEVVVTEGEVCCGSLTHHMGQEKDALARARRMIDAWDQAQVDRIIITASGCGTTIKDYGHMLRLDPAYAEKAKAISAKTRDITEFLTEIDLPEVTAPRALRIAYHSACSMQHGQKIKTAPRQLLERAGFEVTDVPEGHLCCGSAGTYNILQPEIAARLRDRKVANIKSVAPDIIATGNIGCITQIGQASDIPILHTVELLDWAHGGYQPKILRERSEESTLMARFPKGVTFTEKLKPGYNRVLTGDAVSFIARLHRHFEARRRALIKARADRQKLFDKGVLPDFLPQTRAIRESKWMVAPIPADLQDRRVEITGPTDRKMVINALNSGAKVFMTDFEDSNSPTWDNMIQGQINLMDRWANALDFTDAQSGKTYKLGKKPAVLLVRPRGWHLLEEHMLVDGAPVAGALFDFGLYFFHNAKAALAQKSGPYFYLPKMQGHHEARLWNDVFIEAQSELGLALGTIKATVLIETLPAAFEMDEILFELRDHIAGLNCGRWDYIFSFIKTFASNKRFVLPDRAQVVMSKAFLANYSALLIQTCHKRRAFAMGGMAAQIPNRKDEEANRLAFEKVRADKEREAKNGHDGTWVAHPDLVPVAREVFDALMPTANQLYAKREDVQVGQKELLELHEGTKTEAGFRENIRVGVQYIEAWLRGRGAVPIYNLMEDAATAEISRSQIWQWLKFGARLEGGRKVTKPFFEKCLKEEMERVATEVGAEAYKKGRFREAIDIFRKMSTSDHFETFLTLPAYKKIV